MCLLYKGNLLYLFTLFFPFSLLLKPLYLSKASNDFIPKYNLSKRDDWNSHKRDWESQEIQKKRQGEKRRSNRKRGWPKQKKKLSNRCDVTELIIGFYRGFARSVFFFSACIRIFSSTFLPLPLYRCLSNFWREWRSTWKSYVQNKVLASSSHSWQIPYSRLCSLLHSNFPLSFYGIENKIALLAFYTSYSEYFYFSAWNCYLLWYILYANFMSLANVRLSDEKMIRIYIHVINLHDYCAYEITCSIQGYLEDSSTLMRATKQLMIADKSIVIVRGFVERKSFF